MENLYEQFQSHIVKQTLDNTLENIKIALESDDYDEAQEDSLFAYQQLLLMIRTNLNTKTLPMVPRTILDNLHNAIANLTTNVLCDMNKYYSQYLTVLDWYKRIPTYEKKSEIKESFNSIIRNYNNQKDQITNILNEELENFKKDREKQFNNWANEKQVMQNELETLKDENSSLRTEIKKFQTELDLQTKKLQTIIEKFEEDYNTQKMDFKDQFEANEVVYTEQIDNLIDLKTTAADKTLEHLEKRKNEVEKLWGIIGKAAISGNSKNYADKANHLANTMMYIALGIMIIVVVILAITTIIDLSSGQFNYLHFIYKIIGSTIVLLPAFYCSNISKRHRDREFLLRDFEVKTAALEPFMENMILKEDNSHTNEINKDRVKLELAKSFFEQHFDKKTTNDCVLLPKEVAKILNTVAKKCNLNINIGDKKE